MPGLFDPPDESVIAGDGLPLDLGAPPSPAETKPQPTDWRALAPLLAVLPLALKSGGRVGTAALLRGFERARLLRGEEDRRNALAAENRSYRTAQLDSLRSSRDSAAQHAQAQRDAAEEAKRQTFFQQFNQAMSELDSPEDVALQVPLWQARARSLGIAEDPWAFAPTPAALSKRKAQKELEKLQKARPDDWQNWSVTIDGRDVPATELAGITRSATAPPAAPKTFGAPDFYRVNGKVVQLRAGSDGKMYNDQGQIVTGAQPYQPPSTAQPDFVTIVSPDGKTQRLAPKASANRLLEQGWTLYDATAARQSAADTREAAATTGARSQARTTIAALAEDLANDPNLADISGAIEGRLPWSPVLPGNAEAMRKYNELLAKLVLERRGDFKGQGAVSNFEQQTVERAVGLDRLGSHANLRNKILSIANEYRGGAAAAPKVGDVVTVKGRKVRVTAINPDGTFEGEAQ